MALVLKDRVQETTTTTGTGTITLAGAVTGFQSFSAVGDGNTTYYAIVGGSEWELGLGTYTASGTTLSRDSVFSSSNSGSLVDFAAGSKTVFVTYPAERAVYVLGSGVVSDGGAFFINKNTASSSTTLNSGENAMCLGPVTLSTGVNVTVTSGQKWMIFETG